jgi:hypothetical protein
MHTYPRYTVGLGAVYRNSRVVSRPGRAGAGGSGRGVANRSYRAVYRARAAVYRRRRRGRRLRAADRGERAAEGVIGGHGSHERVSGAASRSSKCIWASWVLTGRPMIFLFLFL